MARIRSHAENFRVVVEPRGLGDYGWASMGDRLITGGNKAAAERMYRERCEEIASAIKRHVDDVRFVEIECDEVFVCEHCGYDWTERSDAYNGGCCEADEAAEEERQARVGGA